MLSYDLTPMDIVRCVGEARQEVDEIERRMGIHTPVPAWTTKKAQLLSTRPLVYFYAQ